MDMEYGCMESRPMLTFMNYEYQRLKSLHIVQLSTICEVIFGYFVINH